MSDTRRIPIVMSEHSIALLTIFKRTDYIDDLWAVDWIMEECQGRHKRSARQFIEAMEGNWSVSFLESLKDEIDRALEHHKAEMSALLR